MKNENLEKLGFIFKYEKQEKELKHEHSFYCLRPMGKVLKLNKKFLKDEKYYFYKNDEEEFFDKAVKDIEKKVNSVNESKISKLYSPYLKNLKDNNALLTNIELNLISKINLKSEEEYFNGNGMEYILDNFQYFKISNEAFFELVKSMNEKQKNNILESVYFKSLSANEKNVILSEILDIKDAKQRENLIESSYLG